MQTCVQPPASACAKRQRRHPAPDEPPLHARGLPAQGGKAACGRAGHRADDRPDRQLPRRDGKAV